MMGKIQSQPTPRRLLSVFSVVTGVTAAILLVCKEAGFCRSFGRGFGRIWCLVFSFRRNASLNIVTTR
jgi:hypothetical protein